MQNNFETVYNMRAAEYIIATTIFTFSGTQNMNVK